MTDSPGATPGGNSSPPGPQGGGSERREALRSASRWAKAGFFAYPPAVAAGFILGLSAVGEADTGRARIAPGHAGSIDSRMVRELVEEILEGGRDAFETRRRKYGF